MKMEKKIKSKNLSSIWSWAGADRGIEKAKKKKTLVLWVQFILILSDQFFDSIEGSLFQNEISDWGSSTNQTSNPSPSFFWQTITYVPWLRILLPFCNSCCKDPRVSSIAPAFYPWIHKVLSRLQDRSSHQILIYISFQYHGWEQYHRVLLSSPMPWLYPDNNWLLLKSRLVLSFPRRQVVAKGIRKGPAVRALTWKGPPVCT